MSKTTAVQDHLTISTADMKLYLRVDGSADDALIDELVGAAKHDADDYLNNPFNEVRLEELGRGDGTTTDFTNDANRRPIFAHTETVIVRDLSANTDTKQVRDQDYTINYTSGTVSFTTAPETGEVVFMTYEFDLANVNTPANHIPGPVTRWIKQRVARDYEVRMEGMSQAQDESGSVRLGSSTGAGNASFHDYALLRPYRIRPGF